jgi:hypothetical protein
MVTVQFGAGAGPVLVSEAVTQLVQGELRTMIASRLTMATLGLLAASVSVSLTAAAAGFLALGGEPRQEPEKNVAAPAPPKERDDGHARLQSMNNLKHLGLAMHNFAQAHHDRFPPAAIRKDGKALLSWRVAILPYLDQDALYKKFHLDEPWDSPHNRTLLREIPSVYAPVRGQDLPEGSTCYQVFVGPRAIFDGDEGTRLADITDGTSATLMIVEAARPVPWTRPEDLTYDDQKPLPELGGQFADGFHAGLADGAALFINKQVDPGTLRALVTRNGGEVIDFEKLHPQRRPRQ